MVCVVLLFNALFVEASGSGYPTGNICELESASGDNQALTKQEIKGGKSCSNGYLAEATGNKCKCPAGKSCVEGNKYCQYTCPVSSTGILQDGKFCKDTQVTGENNQYAQEANCACANGGQCTESGSKQKCADAIACSSYNGTEACDAADGCRYYQGECKDASSTVEVKKTCADITPTDGEKGDAFKARCADGPNCKKVEGVQDDVNCSEQAGKCKCEKKDVAVNEEDYTAGASTCSVFGLLLATYWMV